ncbi:hypothetical protein RJ639_023177 [Escallonia herrerae]|uniref:Uncharacterized protein n=1 Tax=Escallonia herrerae TaxID=1293975 RepID=A0AA88UYE1_9ASTE|nr:hypothetical protein RJ639_026268 [Escallonia herrerae]KAK2998130.1 hypothetical protein RJ639_025047 [Escallonia herrerae]KAK2999641.1 hypothetical protein RJ639_023177 [Escallonia herrerae]
MSSFNSNPNPNFENLLLQTLIGTSRLQLRHPPPPSPSALLHSPPFLNQTLESLLLDSLNLSENDDEDNDSDKTQLAKEESRLEKEIIRTILSGKAETLKPNSGQAVSIGEHHICVGFHEETGSDYRVWEWHGHIMLFDEENGYTPEYIYGNYFEKLVGKAISIVNKDDGEKEEEKEEEKVGNLGLRELIGSGDSGGSRILHRNIHAGTTRKDAQHSFLEKVSPIPLLWLFATSLNDVLLLQILDSIAVLCTLVRPLVYHHVLSYDFGSRCEVLELAELLFSTRDSLVLFSGELIWAQFQGSNDVTS